METAFGTSYFSDGLSSRVFGSGLSAMAKPSTFPIVALYLVHGVSSYCGFVDAVLFQLSPIPGTNEFRYIAHRIADRSFYVQLRRSAGLFRLRRDSCLETQGSVSVNAAKINWMNIFIEPRLDSMFY